MSVEIGGEPAVDVGLAAGFKAPSVVGEVVQELRGDPHEVPGAVRAAGVDGLPLCGLAQLPQDVPGREAFEYSAVLRVLDRGQPAGKPLLEQEQEPVHRRQNVGVDEQVPQVDYGPRRLERGQSFVSERHVAAG